ncbi:hypothetical protein H6P81_012319 [Aristolochia fimbriata]|uniref:Uncharacterized protein n=1 Tax=Aristolochia fimbriata TaxID=158543 RepID=A0AAV7EEJ8_ARIFI|nr:hypothetical protein H6P81_012319 [Aristolochia fimbriata]
MAAGDERRHYSLACCFFLLLLLLPHPTDQLRLTSTAASSSFSANYRRLLSTTTHSTMKLHPDYHHQQQQQNQFPPRQFQASKHEVPSGPNPISNRFTSGKSLHGLNSQTPDELKLGFFLLIDHFLCGFMTDAPTDSWLYRIDLIPSHYISIISGGLLFFPIGLKFKGEGGGIRPES